LTLTPYGGSFEEVKRKTKIIYNQADVNQLGNKCNIDFCTVDDNVDDIIFVVNEELSLYNLSIHGYLNDRRSRLSVVRKVKLWNLF
jgi:hypothetical protein